jgi:hypothetical protein
MVLGGVVTLERVQVVLYHAKRAAATRD